MNFSPVLRAANMAGRRAMSIGNNAAKPYTTPTVPAVNAEALGRQGLKFSAWGAPAVLAVGWLFWTRKDEIIFEVKGILGIEDEE